MREGGADVGCCAIEVICEALYIDSNTRRAIALIVNVFVAGGICASAKGLVDCRLDTRVGHRLETSLSHSRSKRSVVIRVWVASELGRNRDVAREL